MIWYVFSCRFGLVWFRMKFDTKLRSYLKIKESTLSRSDEEMANSHHTYISYFIYFHILKWISFHLILATAKFSNHKNELFDFCYCVIFDKIFSVEVDIKFVDSNEPIKFVYDKCVRVCMEKKRFFYSSTVQFSIALRNYTIQKRFRIKITAEIEMMSPTRNSVKPNETFKVEWKRLNLPKIELRYMNTTNQSMHARNADERSILFFSFVVLFLFRCAYICICKWSYQRAYSDRKAVFLKNKIKI